MDWRTAQQAAGARVDPLVRQVLIEIGRSSWGEARGQAWEVVARPAEAAWRLYHLIEQTPAGVWHYQELGVRATVAPDGQVVAFQVDNGEEFLALADVSTVGLRRGLIHLVRQGLPVRASSAPLFARRRTGGLLGRLLRAVRRAV